MVQEKKDSWVCLTIWVFASILWVQPGKSSFDSSDARPQKNQAVSIVESLPREILGLIFKQLGPYTLAYASQVCKQWHDMARDDTLCYASLTRAGLPLQHIHPKTQEMPTSWFGRLIKKRTTIEAPFKKQMCSLASAHALKIFTKYCLKMRPNKTLEAIWTLKGERQALFEAALQSLSACLLLTKDDVNLIKKSVKGQWIDIPDPNPPLIPFGWYARGGIPSAFAVAEPSDEEKHLLAYFKQDIFDPLRYLALFEGALPPRQHRNQNGL